MNGLSQREKWRGYKAARKIALITCDICGGEQSLQRHHKDRNQLNNSEANVEILCQSCHMEKHKAEDGAWGKRKTLQPKPCVICGTMFSPRKARDKLCKNKACLRQLGKKSAELRWESNTVQPALEPLAMDKFRRWLDAHGGN